MNILHISTFDLRGGAAIAAYRLNEAMNSFGINSKMLVRNKWSTNKTVTAVIRRKSRRTRFNHSLDSIKCNLLKPSYTFSLGYTSMGIHKSQLVREADIIYIHWIGFGFLSINEMHYMLKSNKPIVIFMHDMWTITGGCHHSFDCTQYTEGCHICPCIQNTLFKHVASLVFQKKQKKLSSFNNLHIVTPSNWLGECVQKSALFHNHNVCIIPNLIDTNIFKPCEKKVARQILNLPSDKKIILFGASGGNKEVNKGWEYLKQSLTKLQTHNIEIVLFGNELTEQEKQEIPFPTRSFGHADIYLLVLLYSSADVYVTPSLAESFGQTIAEALACGTYVVGFNVGGIPDLIKHRETGYLANYKDIDDLAKGIDWTLAESENHSQEQLYNFVDHNFSSSVVINKHINFLNKIIEHK